MKYYRMGALGAARVRRSVGNVWWCEMCANTHRRRRRRWARLGIDVGRLETGARARAAMNIAYYYNAGCVVL